MSNLKQNVLAVQITKVFYPFVIAKGHDGHFFRLKLSASEQKDATFWDVMKSILQAQLWIPIDKTSYALVEEGWLDVAF